MHFATDRRYLHKTAAASATTLDNSQSTNFTTLEKTTSSSQQPVLKQNKQYLSEPILIGAFYKAIPVFILLFWPTAAALQ